MDRREFLEKLRSALSGKVSAGVIAENLDYYEDYINTEVRKGKSEEQVLSSLGDPRLLAKTIAETSGMKEDRVSGFEEAENGGFRGGADREYGRTEDEHLKKLGGIPGWVWLILFLVIAVLILSVVFRVLAFLAPMLIAIAVVSFLVKMFRDWIN